MADRSNTLFKTKFGSYLYGLATPTSDVDFKTVYLPDIKSLILGKNQDFDSRSKWEENGIEYEEEVMSIHKFLHLAYQGQTMAIDMMWAPKNMWIASSDFWEEIIIPNRHHFITSSMNAFIGYATSQAVKYSNKGNRINNMLAFVEALKSFKPHMTLAEVIDDVKDSADISFIIPNPDNEKMTMIEINGKKFNITVDIKFVVDCLEKEIKKYGSRAKEAAINNGADWKAISHAFRTMYEIEELVTTGDIVFPLKHKEELMSIKLGKVDDFSALIDKLNTRVNEVKALVLNSNYPKTPDVNIEEMIYNLYRGKTI